MRVFLPWTSPLLPAVAARMIADSTAESPESRDADLSAWLIVVRGRAASRRLLGLLAAEAQRADRALNPPRITTPGSLAEELFGRAPAVAEILAQRILIELPLGTNLPACAMTPMFLQRVGKLRLLSIRE